MKSIGKILEINGSFFILDKNQNMLLITKDTTLHLNDVVIGENNTDKNYLVISLNETKIFTTYGNNKLILDENLMEELTGLKTDIENIDIEETEAGEESAETSSISILPIFLEMNLNYTNVEAHLSELGFYNSFETLIKEKEELFGLQDIYKDNNLFSFSDTNNILDQDTINNDITGLIEDDNLPNIIDIEDIINDTKIVDVVANNENGILYNPDTGSYYKIETEEFTDTRIIDGEDIIGERTTNIIDDTKMIEEGYIFQNNQWVQEITETFTNTKTQTEEFTNTRDIVIEFEDTRVITIEVKPEQIIYETEEYVIDSNIYEETFIDTKEVVIEFEDTRMVEETFTNTRTETQEFNDTRDIQVEFQDTRMIEETFTNTRTETQEFQNTRTVDGEDILGVRNTSVIDSASMEAKGYTKINGNWTETQTEEFTNIRVQTEEFTDTRNILVEFDDIREISIPIQSDQIIYETEEYIADDNIYEETFTDTREITIEFEDSRIIQEEFINSRTDTEEFTDTRMIEETFINTRIEIQTEEYQQEYTRKTTNVDYDSMSNNGFTYVLEISESEQSNLNQNEFNGHSKLFDFSTMFGGNGHDANVMSATHWYERGLDLGGDTTEIEMTVRNLNGNNGHFGDEEAKIEMYNNDNLVDTFIYHGNNGNASESFTVQSSENFNNIKFSGNKMFDSFEVENVTSIIEIPAHWENTSGEIVTPNIEYLNETYFKTETREIEVEIPFEDTRTVEETFTNTREIEVEFIDTRDITETFTNTRIETQEFQNTKIVDGEDIIGVRPTDIIDSEAMVNSGFSLVDGIWVTSETEIFTNTKTDTETFTNTREIQVEFADTRDIQVAVISEEIIYETEEYILDSNIYEETFTDNRTIEIEFQDTRMIEETFTNTKTDTETFTNTREIQVEFQDTRMIEETFTNTRTETEEFQNTRIVDGEDIVGVRLTDNIDNEAMETNGFILVDDIYTTNITETFTNTRIETEEFTDTKEITVEFQDTRIIFSELETENLIFETEEYVIDENIYKEEFLNTREIEVEVEPIMMDSTDILDISNLDINDLLVNNNQDNINFDTLPNTDNSTNTEVEPYNVSSNNNFTETNNYYNDPSIIVVVEDIIHTDL